MNALSRMLLASTLVVGAVTSVYAIIWSKYDRFLLNPVKTTGLHPRLVHDAKLERLPSGALLWKSTKPLYDNLKPTKTILLVHGNSGTIDEFAPLVRDCLEPCGFRVYLLEYRGYGVVPGHATPDTLVQDLREAWHALPDPSNTILMGYSIGGGCIGQFLDRHLPPTDKLPLKIVILNSFSALPDVARDHIPLPFLKQIMSQHEWRTSKGLKKYLLSKSTGKVALVYTEDDELIGPHHTQNIIKELNDDKLKTNVQRIGLPTGGHSSSIYHHIHLWIECLKT